MVTSSTYVHELQLVIDISNIYTDSIVYLNIDLRRK